MVGPENCVRAKLTRSGLRFFSLRVRGGSGGPRVAFTLWDRGESEWHDVDKTTEKQKPLACIELMLKSEQSKEKPVLGR